MHAKSVSKDSVARVDAVRASPTGSNRARGKANRCAKRQPVIITTQLNEVVMIAVDFYLFETPCMSDTE